MAEAIEKLVEGIENVEENIEVDSSTLRQNDSQNDPNTRLEPKSNNESSKVEIIAAEQLVNVIEEEEVSAEDDYELRRKEKREACRGARFMPRKKFHELAQHLQEVMEESLPKIVDTHVKELTKAQMQLSKNARISGAENSSQINNAISNHIPSQVDSSIRNYMSGHILHVRPDQASPASTQEQQYQLYLTIKDNPQLQQDDLPIWLALKYKFERLHVFDTPCRPFAIRPRDQDDPHDDAHPEGESSAKRQKTTKHGTYVFGESSSAQVNESEPDDDELPTEKVSQELVEEIDPKALALSLVNQDLFYLKKGNSRPEKIVMSLHKFPAVIFPDDDIEERNSRWVDKYIVARRANGSIVSITELDYKNLNKNDIEDLYLLIVYGKVDDYAETGVTFLNFMSFYDIYYLS
ncbi:hypothetical protein Tco_0167651 [Tanacetum coccineum]